MYTIPAGVVSEAKKALEWRKEEKRGGTPVGLNTARTLARGGQIGIEKLRHIAKYFPRHEVDKKGKGYEPGEDGFPSNGRIAWSLWGGDAGQRWASSIVERENKKATTAGGYTVHGYEVDPEMYRTPNDYDTDVDAFKDAFEMNEGVVPEFMARVRLDGSGMDRLYKLDTDGQVYVWDDMGWDSIGHVDGDVWTYDKALDDPYDTCEKDHVVIDPESAMIMSALLQETPFGIVSINDIAPEEAEMFEYAAPQEDWEFLKSITAAMPPQQKGPTGTVAEDGTYSPKERSINAKSQTRDAGGMFVAKGSRVVVGNDGENGRGIVVGFNPATGGTKVELDNGKTIDVPAKMTQKEDRFKGPDVAPAVTAPSAEELAEPLDVSGVLGEPRSPINQPTAQLPGTQPPMDQKALQDVLQNWGGFVEAQRAAFKPITDQQAKDYAKQTGQKVAPTPATLDPNTTRNAGAASKQIAVPGENGQISVKDAPMMAGRAGVKKDADSKPTGPMREYRASKGDSLWSIAEKTLPKGENLNSWFGAIKKMNEGKKLYSNSGVALPPGSSQYKQQQPYPSSSVKPAAPKPAAPAPKKADPRNAPGTTTPRPVTARPADPRNSPGANKETKPTGPMREYRASKGDSLWSIAEKTVPKGKDVGSWFNAIKQANAGKKLYSNSGVSLPPGSSQYKQGMPYPSSSIKPDAAKPAAAKPGIKPVGPNKVAGNAAKGLPKPGAKPAAKPAPKVDPATARKIVDDAKEYGEARKAEAAKAAPVSDYDDKGRYIVKKDDSLWSIANKTKPEGVSIAKHWADIMKANPNVKSGNPSLIYSGERVNVPNSATVPYKPGVKPPAKQPNFTDRVAQGRKDTAAKSAATAKADAAKSRKQNADAKEYGEAKKAATPSKPAAKPAAKSADPKYKPVGPNKIAGNAKKALDATNKPAAKPAAKAAPAMREYRATKGESLWSIAEKTVPKGESVESWFGAIKEMNKGKKLYSNSGIALPPGSSQYKQGAPSPSSKPAPKPKGSAGSRKRNAK
jgi:LysM repeat protein